MAKSQILPALGIVYGIVQLHRRREYHALSKMWVRGIKGHRFKAIGEPRGNTAQTRVYAMRNAIHDV